MKKAMEDLLQGKTCKAHIDEEFVFNRLDMERDAIWSLLLTSGYLKVVGTEDDGVETEYEFDKSVDKSLKETVGRALKQAADKKYAAALEAKGVQKEKIRIYGFAFRGKEVFIDGGNF